MKTNTHTRRPHPPLRGGLGGHVLGLGVLLVLLLSCQPSPSPLPALHWQQMASFPDGPRSSAAACAVGDTAYVLFGRRAAKTQFMHDCWAYHPATDQWTERTPCPGHGRVKPVAVPVGGQIYTGLGYTDTTYVHMEHTLYQDSLYLRDWWCYDPASDSWTPKAHAPFQGTDACVAFAHADEVYVGLGYGALRPFGREWWRYSPAHDNWTQLDDFPGASRSAATLCADGERVWMGTGFNTYNLKDWWEYRPATGSWRELRSMPDRGRVNATALCLGGRVLVTAGRAFHGPQTGGGVIGEVLEYDPGSDTWYNAGELPGGARENAIAFTIGSCGYIGLGEDDDALLGDLWRCSPH